jgi:hypothetical protein
MKSIEEIKDGIPKGVILGFEKQIEEGIEKYAIQEYGIDKYEQVMESKKIGDSTLNGEIGDYEALDRDFRNGFWYAIDILGIKFD